MMRKDRVVQKVWGPYGLAEASDPLEKPQSIMHAKNLVVRDT